MGIEGFGFETCPNCKQAWYFRQKLEFSDECYCQNCGLEKKEKVAMRRAFRVDTLPANQTSEQKATQKWALNDARQTQRKR